MPCRAQKRYNSEMPPSRYQESGVSIAAGDEVVRRVADLSRQTHPALQKQNAQLLAAVGGFAAAVEIPKLQNPVLLAATDGVGTKIEPLLQSGNIQTAGIDLVAMCVNDLLCQGGNPLFFLDYYACGKLNPESAAAFLQGVADGCALAECALVGGETAEMPGVYPPDGMDAAGFAVGLCERDKLLPAKNIAAGDKIIGIASSGPHSNGFSLIRKIMRSAGPQIPPQNPEESKLLESLLAPTRIYVRAMSALRAKIPVLSAAHITGGGLTENLPRAIPPDLAAKVFCDSWARPPVFDFLQKSGKVDEDEMRRVFNCGIGFAVVVRDENAQDAAAILRDAGERAFVIGEIVARTGDSGAVFA